ncbi:hypothetical protein [Mucilaginibacter gossypii]|uniref:WYL domain-containing protein n=1 Tax=Mucilaginibacter gossypii TaxID=551996 RepID=A0A1G7VIB9_9SPHI|nr:hypothetical protein [Mucilaginibacter gossypii]SDG59139.1 hypothetical protein SAMN05192573_10460 [Mucilaginibacter gossypii]
MPKFTIGDAVILKTHPFQETIHSIVISGEYLMTPPIMVVTEVINHDEDVDPPILNKYKCVWFSSKKNQFQESNLLETDLRRLEIEGTDYDNFLPGSLVALKTLPVELGKERSFMHSELSSNSSKKTNTLSGLLSFVSPIMTLCEIKEHDLEKGSKVSPDIKRKKIYPDYVAKCKWFNAVGEKFSEELLPLASLMIIMEPDNELLSILDKAIKEETCINCLNTILKPLQLSNRSGIYYITYFDYVLNRNVNKEVSEIIDPIVISNPFKTHAPIFKKRKKGGKSILKLTTEVETLLNNALKRKSKNYLFIKYQDRFGQITTRTLSNYEVIEGEDDLSPTKDLVKYLRAFCHLRGSDRNFRVKSIIEISELRLAF